MDIAVITLVSLIALVAHLWLYRWVRFKIDEGLVLDALAATRSDTGMPVADIAAACQLKQPRVLHVCATSAEVIACVDGEHYRRKPPG